MDNLKRCFNFILLALVVAPVWGQGNIRYAYGEPSTSERTKGLDMGEDEFILEKSVTTYRFRKADTDLGFEVEETKKFTLFSKWTESLYFGSEFLNGHSEIKELNVTIKIPYYGKRTFPLDAKVRPYDADGIFHADYSIAGYSFFFSEKVPRAEFEIKKVYDDIRYLSIDYFHHRRVTDKKEIRFEIPDWLEIDLIPVNFEGWGIETENFAKIEDASVVSFLAEDLAGLDRDYRAPSTRRYFPHVLMVPKAHTLNGSREPIFATVGDLYSWYSSLVGDLENKREELAPIVQEITQGKSSDLEKAEAIYYWVQDNIRYIAFEDGLAGFRPDGARNVCQKLYGDCKGMANLTKEMLGLAGIDARLTWLGTYDIPYNYSTPCLSVDNHMICTANIDGKRIFLDPTEKFTGLGEYASRIQGKQVLIQDADSYILDSIPLLTGNNVSEYDEYFRIEGELLKCKTTMVLKGEEKTDLLRAMHYVNPEDRARIFKESAYNSNKDLQIHKLDVSDMDDRAADLQIDLEYDLSNAISRFGNEIYMDFDQEEFFKGSFLAPDREQPYDFGNNFIVRSSITLAVPEGYKVKSLPTAVQESLPGCVFSFNLEDNGNEITYQRFVAISERMLMPEHFQAWNDAVRSLSRFYDSQIVFAKQ